MLCGDGMVLCVALLVAAVSGCRAALPSSPPPLRGREGGLGELELPASWVEMFVLQLGECDCSSQLLEAARRSALPVTFSAPPIAADTWMQVNTWFLQLPMSSAASEGRVVTLAATSPETVWRYLAPRKARLFLRAYVPHGALLLLVLDGAGNARTLQLVAELLMRLRGALRLLVLTSTGVLRMEPFERWAAGWGALRRVGAPLPLAQALDWPAPAALGRMRGFRLLLAHEPRDDPRVYDRLHRPAWQHTWNGQLLGLIRDQLNCSFRLTRVNKDYRILSLYDITYSVWPLVLSNIHQFVNPPASVTEYMIMSVPRRDIPLWKQMTVLFRLDVWLSTAVTYVVASFVWYATARAHQWTQGISVSQSLVDTLCVLLSVNWQTSVSGACRRGLAERLQVGALTLLCLALTTIYQGALTDAVYNPAQTPALKTLEDVNRYKDNLVQAQIGETISGLQFKNKFLTCIAEEKVIKYFIYRTGHPIQLQVVKDPVETRYSSFGIPSRSPYSEAFNIAVGRIMQAGIMPDPSVYFSAEQGVKPKPFLFNIKEVKEIRVVSLSNSDLRIAFLVLAVGLSLSILIFLFEYSRKASMFQVSTAEEH